MKTGAVLAVLVATTMLTACSQGAPSLEDGSYRQFEASSGAATGGATLELSGSDVTIVADGADVTATLGASGETFVLCPTDREGEPQSLSAAPITVSGIEFTEPALYGDCGDTAPKRVTLVDLADTKAGSVPAFADWIEFCLGTDPDCPA